MKEDSKKIYVYDHFSETQPILLGVLYVNRVRGGETYSFEYDDEWLKKTKTTVMLDPGLLSYGGRQYPADDGGFGIFSDASPDRWGQVLMKKRERILADKELRKPRKLENSDFLLGVYDETRMGGLRFKLDPEGPFLSEDKEVATPPWTTLRTLEEASRNYENDEDTLSNKWLEQLIRPGSSLGGARPKATVADPNGELWIAKFPSKNDVYNAGAWEKVTSDLARMCGLNVPETKAHAFSKYGTTFLSKRFDRAGEKRIHFASAMTLLGKKDGASAEDGTSYLEMVSFIKSNGCNPKGDLLELWKRVVFNMLVSNTDDHLRNHGFVLKDKGWKLSPLYDVNPVPYGDELALNVSENNNTISLELANQVAPLFGIRQEKAIAIIKEMKKIVADNWEELATKQGISHSQIEEMRPAFSEANTKSI